MNKKPFIVAMLLLLVTLIMVVGLSFRGMPKIVQLNLDRLPMILGGFHAENDQFPAAVYEELNADFHLYRHYRSSTGQDVDLYIGYYGTAKGGRSTHNPYACLPGSGWGIIDSKKISLTRKDSTEDVTVNYLLAIKEDLYTTMIHWYQTAGDKVIINGLQQNMDRFIGRLFRNQNDGAYVQVTVYSTESELSGARELGRYFATEIIDLLPDYWPQEDLVSGNDEVLVR